jgi:hypothetical protein
MLLITLLAVFAVVVLGVFVYAVKNAAVGQEDEAGFHYARAVDVESATSAIEGHARVVARS